MGREKEAYRDNLERIDAAYPDKELLSPAEVAKLFGISRQKSGARLQLQG